MSGTETAERPARKKAVVQVAPEDVLADLEQPVRRAVAPALEVGGVHDAAEHEADRLAARVVARLRAQESGEAADDGASEHAHHGHEAGVAHRSPAPAPAVPFTVGREGGSAGPELTSTIESMRGGGRALDADVRRSMGEAFGRDLSGVRLHTDGRAAAAAAQMGAVAFTTGRDIFFGAGQYRPDTDAGRHVLAHELAHTVQQEGSARRKVSRLWDLSSDEGTDVRQAAKIKVLEERLVMFLTDDGGDTMVVKLEKEPIGLGVLVGEMHKKLNGTETIKYRKLSKMQRAYIKMLLGIDNLLDKKSFTKRGNVPRIASGWKHIADPVERGAQAVKDEIDAFQDSEILAMSLAPGESAESRAEKPADPKGLRAILEAPGHAKALGRMTAVDLLVGNRDRALAGNLGNWFYDPNGSMVMLDNVDGGGTMGSDAKGGVIETQSLRDLKKDQLKATAVTALENISGAGGMGKAGDPGADAWMKATLPSGRTRLDTLSDEFAAGLKEGKAYVVKVFSSTRWTRKGKDARKMKKAIKADARAAAAMDAGDDGAPQYYETLKARAAWLAKN